MDKEHPNLPERCDSQFLRDLVKYHFGGYGGGVRLARTIGVAESTATLIRQGHGDLTKVAALYRYAPSPDHDDVWLRQPHRLDPATAGRFRWTPQVDERIKQALQQRFGLRALAIELGTTRARILDRIAGKGLDQPEGEDPAILFEASRQRMIARLETEDQQRAAKRQGGTAMPEQDAFRWRKIPLETKPLDI